MKTLAAIVLGGATALAVMTAQPACAAADQAAPSALRQVQDRQAITDMMARYEWALDSGDAQAYGALFAEDAVLVSTVGNQTGRPAIVKMIEDLVKRFAAASPGPAGPNGRRPMRLQHILSNLVIDLHGDTADAKSFWTEVWNPKGAGLEVRVSGHYEDKLVRRNGKWWFARREIVDDIMPGAPLTAG